MKLTYSNWHKELVHDDAIQQELSRITGGELEFNNRPFVKHRADSHMDREDYPAGRNQYRKNFSGRDRQGGGQQQGGGGNRPNANRGGQGGGGGNRPNNNRNFKKRF